MKSNNRFFFFIFLFLLVIKSFQCHYSCLNCTDSMYKSCLSCPQNQTVSTQITSYAGSSAGTCATFLKKLPNVLGIILVTVSITTCSVFGGEKIFYFIFMFQTLGLLFLMEVYWTTEINFILQSFSYLMVFSYISFPIKNSLYNFNSRAGYKSIFYLKNANLTQNVIIIGPVAVVLFSFLIIFPLIKACRSPSPRRCLPDWKLQKIIQGISTFFFFIIQQMMVIIFISLSSSKQITSGDIVITVSYLFLLLLYIFNQCQHPLPFFRNRYSQFFTFIERIIGPLFLTFSPKYQWIFYLYTFFFLVFEAISTNDNRDKGGINRLFFYKFGFLLPFGSSFLYFIIETTVNSQKVSKIVGIITLLLIIFFIFLFLMELLFSFQVTFCPKKILQDSSVTEQTISVEPEIELQKKVFAGNFKPEAVVIKSKKMIKTQKEEKEEKVSNNESIQNLGVTILDFSSIAVQPNLVFTMPDEQETDADQKAKQKIEQIENIVPYDHHENSPQSRKKSESNITQQSRNMNYKFGEIDDIE